MVFVGAAIFPHGTMPFDGDPNSDSTSCRERHASLPENLKDKCSTLYKSYIRLAEHIARKEPEIVVLYTPHGINLTSGAAGIYMANVGKGNALWNNCWEEFEVQVNLDSSTAVELLKYLQRMGLRADGIETFGKTEAPLRWGEVVPLWPLEKKLQAKNVKYIIITVGKNAVRNELHALGEALQGFISSLPQKVAVVMSGDLAHTHKHSCDIPLYLPDPRWSLLSSDIAEEFDSNLEFWARGIPQKAADLTDFSCERREWKGDTILARLDWAWQYQGIAKVCGLWGFTILHSLLTKDIQQGGTITSCFVAREAPTYYGMMSVFFDK